MTSLRPSIGFVLVTSVALVAYLVIPNDDARSLLHSAIGAVAVACVLYGVRAHRPASAGVWYTLVVALSLLVIGDLIANVASLASIEVGFPSFIDLFYISGNLAVVLAVVFVIRARSPYRDIGGFIDSAILATTATFLAWTFYMQPSASDPSLSGLQKSVSLLYPALSTLMFIVAARLVFTRGRRPVSLYLVLAAMGSSLVGDVVYAELLLLDAYFPGHPVDLAYVLWFVFWAAAALHPSMVSVTAGSDIPALHMSSQRLGLLVGAVLLVPATTAARWLRDDEVSVPVFVAFSSLLFLLVFWRMRNSIRLSERAYGERQLALERERVFHEVASGLAVSSTHADAFDTVTTALRSISAGQLSVHIALVEGNNGIIATSCEECDANLLGQRFHLRNTNLASPRPADGTSRAREIVEAIKTDIPLLNQRSHHEIHVVNPNDELVIVLILLGPYVTYMAMSDLLRGIGNQLVQAIERISLAEDINRRKNQEVFHSLVRNSSDVTIIIEPHSVIRYVSPAAQTALGFAPDDLVGHPLRAFIHPTDADAVDAFLDDVRRQPGVAQSTEFRLRGAEDDLHYVEAVANNLVNDPDVGGIVLNVHDITVRKRSEALLEYQAFHDALTSLPNRALFLDRLSQAMKWANSHDERVAVLFIDIDRFKFINDTLGHDGGDALLIMMSQRIQQSVVPDETVARLGGDEFTVMLNTPEHAANPSAVADRLVKRLGEPFVIKGREVAITVSIGVATNSPHHDSSDDLLRGADIAMYQAKSQGRNGYVVFDTEMGQSMVRRVTLEQDLRRALVNDEFTLHYQPEIDLETGRIVWLEALIRWQHPERGWLSPSEFVPLAEESGLILAIGRWIIREACSQTQTWRDRFPDYPFGVSVNLSTRQLLDPGLIDEITSCLERSGMPPSALRMEITETTLMQEMEVSLGTLNALRRLGVKLAIDDFGHGYSSLGYLRYFPLDVLKLDRSFLSDAARSEQDDAIIQAVTTLAHSLNVRVTVEGIETEDQLSRVRTLACDHGQGYLFSRPREVRQVPELLARESLYIAGLDRPMAIS